MGDFANAGGPSQTLIEHWDGTSWSVIPSPSPGSVFNFLTGIEAISSKNIWAVGVFQNPATKTQTLIEHWDGTSWSVVPSPSPGSAQNPLSAIDAVSAKDIWAVGVSINNPTPGVSPQQTLIEHWDGTSWSVVPSPSPGSGATNSLAGIEAVSAKDSWAVGAFQNTGGPDQTLIEHWNGTSWSVVASPSPGSDNNFLSGIDNISARNIWAVGVFANAGGPSQTLIEHWNGVRWSVVPSPSPGSAQSFLSGVEAVSAKNSWAVGAFQNTAGPIQTLIEHWDGARWSVVPSPSPGSAQNFLSGIEAVSAKDSWAVGAFQNTGGPMQTLVERIKVRRNE